MHPARGPILRDVGEGKGEEARGERKARGNMGAVWDQRRYLILCPMYRSILQIRCQTQASCGITKRGKARKSMRDRSSLRFWHETTKGMSKRVSNHQGVGT